MPRAVPNLVLVAFAVACGQGVQLGADTAHGSRAVHYTFSVPASLERLDAQVCFRGAAPRTLSCGVQWGREYLRGARVRGGRQLPYRDGRIDLSGVGADACVEYSVDLQAVADTRGGLSAERRGDAIVTNLAFWLWRPPDWRRLQQVTASFELPAGMQVSVPWPRRADGRYELDDTAFAYFAYAMFGRFERERFAAPGAEFEIAMLDGLPPQLRASVRPWIETAARMAAQPMGRFPRDRAQVVVLPAGPRDEPVGFGTVSRGGGASVAVFLPRSSSLEDLQGDWVAVHEFAHLFQPFVAREDAWLSEGLATYYQEVLRVRAGLRSEQYAWRRLWEGSLKGRAARQPLAGESREMFVSFNFPMVYWAGAAYALMADVELRRTGDSLDRVMGELAGCCSAANRPWSAARTVRRMDRIAGKPLFSRLAKRWVQGPRLPDLTQLYAQLGLSVGEDGTIEKRPAPGAQLRDAIMRVDPELASRVSELGNL